MKSADSSGKVSGISIKCKSSHRSPHLSLSNDSHSGDIEAAVSSTQMDTAGHIIIPTKKSRRKRDRTSHFKDTYNAPNGCSGAGLPVLQNKLEDVEVSVLILYNNELEIIVSLIMNSMVIYVHVEELKFVGNAFALSVLA